MSQQTKKVLDTFLVLAVMMAMGCWQSAGACAQEIAIESEIVGWDIPWPDLTAEAGGYPILDATQHYPVFRAPDASRSYHHHPHITYADGQFLVMFSEHATGEDGPGQHLLLTRSNDGATWTEPVVLIPALDETGSPELKGRAMCPNGWVTLGQRTFAIGEVWDNVGYREIGKTVIHQNRTATARQRVRSGLGRIAREVKPDGRLGKSFWLTENPPDPLLPEVGILAGDHPEVVELAKRLTKQLARPINPTSWDFQDPSPRLMAIDGHRMSEPTGTRRRDGSMIKFYRDLAMSHRVYVSVSTDEGITWTTPRPTHIPDSASKSVVGRLPDQGLYLIGNFVSGPEEQVFLKHYRRDPLVLALSDDGVVFDRAFAIVHQAPPIRIKGPGKGRGFQYPDAIVVGGDLWVVYSINKEDIAVAQIPLASLKKNVED